MYKFLTILYLLLSANFAWSQCFPLQGNSPAFEINVPTGVQVDSAFLIIENYNSNPPGIRSRGRSFNNFVSSTDRFDEDAVRNILNQTLSGPTTADFQVSSGLDEFCGYPNDMLAFEWTVIIYCSGLSGTTLNYSGQLTDNLAIPTNIGNVYEGENIVSGIISNTLEGEGVYLYRDFDFDGFGSQTDSLLFCGEFCPISYVDNSLDCDDFNNDIYPGAPNGGATLAMSNTTNSLSVSGSTYFSNGCSNLIAKVDPTGGSTLSGDVEAKVWFDGTVQSAGQPYVQRHHEIIPSTNAATATGTVTLYYTQAEFDAFNSDVGSTLNLPVNLNDATGKANLRITKYSGASSDGTGMPGSYSSTPVLIDPVDTDIVWNATMSRWEVAFTVTGFSGFFVHTGNVALPVEISYFQVEEKGKRALLTWETATEENNEGFHIQRSPNTSNFETIGWVNGAGNTVEVQEYIFIDENPMTGISYYRLKQIDFDGQFAYSKVISVNFKGENGEAGEFYPNPSKSGIVNLEYITHSDDKISISVFDITGKLVINQTQQVSIGGNILSFDFSDLSTGIYLVKIGGGTNPIHRKLIIE